ncbi:MAG: hypothetical protein VB143_03675, partial [Burkholderia sp.]
MLQIDVTPLRRTIGYGSGMTRARPTITAVEVAARIAARDEAVAERDALRGEGDELRGELRVTKVERDPAKEQLKVMLGVVAQIRREDEVVPLFMISGNADGLRAGEFSHAVEHAHSNG